MFRYRSRVSVVLLVFIVITICPVFFLPVGPNELNEAIIGYAVLGVSMLSVAFLLFLMAYEMDEQYLTVRIGPIRLARVKIDTIEQVRRSYNPLSSPASSLKRLHIKAKGKDLLISPAREDEFIRNLKARNPKIQVHINDSEDWWRFWDWDV